MGRWPKVNENTQDLLIVLSLAIGGVALLLALLRR
jgi:hypothetical protein